MNALMRSSRFDDMPTVSALANGRSAWAEGRCDVTMIAKDRTASASHVRSFIWPPWTCSRLRTIDYRLAAGPVDLSHAARTEQLDDFIRPDTSSADERHAAGWFQASSSSGGSGSKKAFAAVLPTVT